MNMEEKFLKMEKKLDHLTKTVEKISFATKRAGMTPEERADLNMLCVEAVVQGDAVEVRWLLEAGASLIQWCHRGPHDRCNGYRTLFSMACEAGHLEVVKVFDYFNAIDNRREPNGMTPLKYASKNGHTHIVAHFFGYSLFRADFEEIGYSNLRALERSTSAGDSDAVAN